MFLEKSEFFCCFGLKTASPTEQMLRNHGRSSIEELGCIESCLQVEADYLATSNVDEIAVVATEFSNRNRQKERTIGIRQRNTYCRLFRNQGHSR